MPDRRVQIIATGSGSAAFLPVQDSAQVGGSLTTRVGDTVMWRNTTDHYHWPWPLNDHFVPLKDEEVKPEFHNFLSYPIPPQQPSPASYGVHDTLKGRMIFYCCKLHPEERGLIVVAA